MKFVTSYYARINEIREKYPDYIIVSISGGLEEYIKPLIDIWDKRLAPKRDFFNVYKNSPPGFKREQEYVKQFKKRVLIREDDVTLNDILKSWSDRAGLNKTFVIMCYEANEPGSVSFCHRRIVAEAIEQKYAIDVPELFFDYENYEIKDYKVQVKETLNEDEW